MAIILDALMSSHVGLVICTFIKSFSANSAVVLVLSCVQLHVPLEASLDGETFITQVAREVASRSSLLKVGLHFRFDQYLNEKQIHCKMISHCWYEVGMKFIVDNY